jgi:hypothetical protein
MNAFCETVKVILFTCVSFVSLLFITSCSSEPEVAPLPYCNYAANIYDAEQIKYFVWRDKRHATFDQDWRQSSVFEISKRYQYLDRKSLPDAVKARNEIIWLLSKLNSLEAANNIILNQIEMNLCNNQQAPLSVGSVKQQNAGIDYIRTALSEISEDVEAKAQKIIAAAQSE